MDADSTQMSACGWSALGRGHRRPRKEMFLSVQNNLTLTLWRVVRVITRKEGDKGDGKRGYRSRQMLFFSCLVLFPLGLAFWLCFSRHLLIMRTSS